MSALLGRLRPGLTGIRDGASAVLARFGRPPGRTTAGWRAIARKELADNLLSVRFVVLMLVLGLAGVVAVSRAAGALRDAADQSSGAPAPFLMLFTESPEQIPSFVVLVGFLGPLLGIAFGFDAINNERAQGTLARLVSHPVHRDDVINGKFVAGLSAIGIALTSVMAVMAGTGILRLGITPGPEELARLLAYLLLAVVYVAAWLGFALLCSVVLSRAATSALVAIAVWLLVALFGTLLIGMLADAVAPAGEGASTLQQIEHARLEQRLSRVLPVTLYYEATGVLLNPSERTTAAIVLPAQVDRAVPGTLPLSQSLLVVWPQLVTLIAAGAIVFVIAYIRFLRQEVRA